MAKFRKLAIRVFSVIGASFMLLGTFLGNFNPAPVKTIDTTENNLTYKEAGYSINSKVEDYFNPDVVFKLPDTLSNDDDISVIVSLESDSLIDIYEASGKTLSFSKFLESREGKNAAKKLAEEQNKWISKLDKSGIKYTFGSKYDTLLNGFEITIKGGDFRTVGEFFSTDATLILGETYLPAAATKAVTNEVKVYESGIFDSSDVPYQGDGVVIAVLDTGLDYTHTAFSVDNFETSNERFTLDTVSEKIKGSNAEKLMSGLTGQDVYLNKKVPFAFDYADNDPDVLPISSEHGTHVAGIIAGKDDVITGVAPNAQLAIMKVFSDSKAGAKSAWILNALEDCTRLNVDVINMSLGATCGFAREEDKERVNEIYDNIGAAGISLIAAAGNEYISTYGSAKNGSLNLTTNPDAGTIGSPASYAAPLSVASVDGVKTPYFMHNGEIIYFTEAATSSAKTKKFVDDILYAYNESTGKNVTEHTFEYVTIPGIGRASDYAEDKSFYEGKIVLVKRGTSTFEEKVYIALKVKGALGIIIYNNVPGEVTMSVGKDVGAVCALSQDDGNKLASLGSGTITIGKNLSAGPFMSDFSSWGPTSDLQIKPEITAHGGEIYSAVPGQGYDSLSGTSMATPNQAGATALIRQYVRQSGKFGDYAEELSYEKAREVTALVNQLMMSTADIVLNKNGLPYAVRKQGAGLVNIEQAISTESFVQSYDQKGNLMDRTKFELGDDKERTGVYSMKFLLKNINSASATYDVSCIAMSESVSETYTSHGETTVSLEARLLDGAVLTVKTVNGVEASSNSVSVEANGSAVVEIEIRLSEADKQYINESFLHGMYMEGFVVLKAMTGAVVDLNVPMLAFFGDWTEAPIFDEEFYDTNKDEINDGLEAEDKLMADAYATRVTGGLYSEYISILGQYAFAQNPAATKIAANKKYIAISNQENDKQSAVNSIEDVYAGLLRNVKEANIQIVEDATGKVIFEKTEYNVRKSSGTGSISASAIDVEFKALEHGLKNNTQYTVTVTTYIDYGEKSEQNNVRNVFEFPLFIDFQAPAVTGVSYRTEYDKLDKKMRLFADIDIYDNHYAMGVQFGQILEASEDSEYTFDLDTFGKYVTPIFSSFNSTSMITLELTDYISRLKNSVSMDPDGKVLNNSNSFIAICYDYALNNSTFEIELPDEVIDMCFTQEEISLSPNETKLLDTLLEIYPLDTWSQILDYTSSDPSTVGVVNQTLIAKKSGTATITVTGYNAAGEEVTAKLSVKVLAEGEEGYKKYDVPAVNNFKLMGYKVDKAYYAVNSNDREIGITDGIYNFGDGMPSLSMYPSEAVTLSCLLDSNFPEKTTIVYKSNNPSVATVDERGRIFANAEGSTIINVSVELDGESTFYTEHVTVSVKDPYITRGMYLMSYKGLGGVVELPTDRGIEIIQSYAFSNYEYVEKDENDIIDEDDPYMIKQMYIGDKDIPGEKITKVIIPDGVTAIESYAFAAMVGLEEVVLPKSLIKIGIGAFYGCEKLTTINLENVKFINKDAFANTQLGKIALDSVVAIGDYAFENTLLANITLPETSQSLGIGAFRNNKYLESVEFLASKIKIGESAFESCSSLNNVAINAAVIARKSFYNCSALTELTLGKDVEVIAEYAFANTNVAKFKVDNKNGVYSTDMDGAVLLKNSEVVLVAPKYNMAIMRLDEATSIAPGAFVGKTNISRVVANKVTTIGDYAFAECTALKETEFDSLEVIGNYAFYKTGLESTPNLQAVTEIGDYAFAESALTTVELPSRNDMSALKVGDFAFANCNKLKEVIVGDNIVLGKNVFVSEIDFNDYENYIVKHENDETKEIKSYDDLFAYLKRYYTKYDYSLKDESNAIIETYTYYRYNIKQDADSVLEKVTIGNDVVIGDNCFSGNINLEELTIGFDVFIGNYAFYNASALTEVDLSGANSVGDYAFSGLRTMDLWFEDIWQYDGKGLKSAFVQKMADGQIVYEDYIYSNFGANLTEVNLFNATSVGEGAFENNTTLTNLTLGDKVVNISKLAFSNTSVGMVTLPSTLEIIGDYAFYGSNIAGNINLSTVDKVGRFAFALTDLQEITVAENAIIGEGAFFGCQQLSKVNNLDKVILIEARVFAETALTQADITSAVEVGDFAFGESKVTKVIFGANLEKLGENPFYGCEIETFATDRKLEFNGNEIGTETVDTYDVNDKKIIKIINDVIYQVVPNGLELITYPMRKDQVSYTVEEGTVRISARAFFGASLVNVVLPTTLKSIGDRAFFDCNDLSVVVFKGYTAPLFEEEYLPEYVSYEELPFTGSLRIYEGEEPVQGLGIVPFYMWNAVSGWNNYYFGANFVDRIGHETGHLVMSRPANGQNYNSFIMSQYFNMVFDGTNAATKETLNVIAMIDALPKEIMLKDEQLVLSALAAYNNLPSEQQELVKKANYQVLNEAISVVEYLKSNLPNESPEIETPENIRDNNGKTNVVPIIILSVIIVGLVAYIVLDKFVFKKKGVAVENDSSDNNETNEKTIEE